MINISNILNDIDKTPELAVKIPNDARFSVKI